MGWGTNFTADHYISREYYNSLAEVENRIIEINRNIEKIKSTIFGYICATPKDIIPTNKEEELNDDIMFVLKSSFENNIEEYEENLNLLFELQYLKDNWDTKEDS